MASAGRRHNVGCLSLGELAGGSSKQALAAIPLGRVPRAVPERYLRRKPEQSPGLVRREDERLAEEIEPPAVQRRIDPERLEDRLEQDRGCQEGPHGQPDSRHAAAQHGGDDVDHLPGREHFLPRQDEGLAHGRGMSCHDQQGPHEVVHVHDLAPVLAAADHQELAAVDGTKQLQEAEVSRSVGFGYAHDAGLDFAGPFADHAFRGKLGPAIDIVRIWRARLVERALRGRAIDSDRAAVDETTNTGLATRRQQAIRAGHIDGLEIAVGNAGLVLRGGEVNDGVAAGDNLPRKLRILQLTCPDRDARALQFRDARVIGVVLDHARDRDVHLPLARLEREPRPDEAGSTREQQFHLEKSSGALFAPCRASTSAVAASSACSRSALQPSSSRMRPATASRAAWPGWHPLPISVRLSTTSSSRTAISLWTAYVTSASSVPVPCSTAASAAFASASRRTSGYSVP